jgi:hypothetical protein
VEEVPPLCLVQRLTMDDWRRRSRSESPNVYHRTKAGVLRPARRRREAPPPHGRYRPPPHIIKSKGSPSGDEKSEPDYVVKAYYRNVPTKIAATDNISTDEDFKRAYTQGRNREKPSRVEINSEILVEELQELTGLTLEDDPFV